MLSYPWWILLFFVIGIIAVVGSILTLFSKLGRRPGEIVATAVPPVDSEDFLRALSGVANAPSMEGGHARMLNNGDEVFPALLEAIAGARHTVNWMAYIWEPGEASDLVFDALVERARAGVEVRVLLDGMGCMRTPSSGIERLRAAGGKVAWFRPAHFGKLTRFYERNHRRAIVIDGRVGFTGGFAVADYWLGNAQDPDHWRDSMFRVTGCIASNVQSAFTQLWASSTGEILVGPNFYPQEFPPDEAGEEISRHINVISSPSNEYHPLRTVFWLSFRAARERLWITTPYFIPGKNTRKVLAERARAGVDVRILVPNEHIDAPPIRWASHFYFKELLEAGVRIYEYQPTMIHAKLLVVDGRWSLVGSANVDIRSKELNEENVLAILDRGLGEQMERTYLADLERAKEIRLEQWRRRGVWNRVQEGFFVIFSEQY